MKIKFTFLFFLISASIFAQKVKVSGVVKDADTNEPLVGASVTAGNNVTNTDASGNFVLEVDNGTYNIEASYISYEKQTKVVNVKNKNIFLSFAMQSNVNLSEVQIIGDVAKFRETPIAFTNISSIKLEEELSGRDLPMVLNSTPGVYASESGGGDGDAVVRLRGFNQRNIAVLIDGVPVNDMETGWVYWSNWFGLDMVTRTFQIQRGLGASKLAIPSVGGTKNIITKGIDAKKEFSIKQEYDFDGKERTSIMFNSGKLPKGWGYTLAGSMKIGDNYAYGMWSKAFFYYAKIEKKFDLHTISLTIQGAPQIHSQRSYQKPIITYSTEQANDLGITYDAGKQPQFIDKGIRYNASWGYSNNYDVQYPFDWIKRKDENSKIYERVNYYHKPQATLRDIWVVNEKLNWTNIAYISIGKGGVIGLNNTAPNSGITKVGGDGKFIYYDESGQINWDKVYKENRGYVPGLGYRAANRQFLRTSVNNHFWYGLLSTANYLINDKFTFVGGLDLRSYKGEHYKEIYDLLGADYCGFNGQNTYIDANNPTDTVKRVGDKYNYNYDGYTRWAGAFGQLEYKKDKLSTFINLTGSQISYKKKDYYAIGRPESKWVNIPGYTAKAGANYNITKDINIFVNIGMMNRAPMFSNVFSRDSTAVNDYRNEKVQSVEIGSSYGTQKFTINLNAYITWTQDRDLPAKGSNVTNLIYSDTSIAYFYKMDAVYKGIEMDFAYKPVKNLVIEGLASFGDWRWKSNNALMTVNDDAGKILATYNINVKDVHISDAAQTQLAMSARYEPFKRYKIYFMPKITYFGNFYSDFDGESLSKERNPSSFNADGSPKDSWKIPDYYTVDIFAGYRFRLKKYRFELRAGVLNLLNEIYINDAQNNDPLAYPNNNSDGVTVRYDRYKGFDAKSASVYYGFGRRGTVSLRMMF